MNRYLVYFLFQTKEDLNIFPKFSTTYLGFTLMGATYCKALIFGSKEYDLSNVQMKEHGQVVNKSVGKFSESCMIYKTF